MRKFVSGLIVGLVVAMTTSVYADDIASMIGKQVDGTYPVKLNGQQLSTESIAIDGTTYLPVRAAAEALGLDVGFENQTVILEQPIQEETNLQTTVIPESQNEGVTVSQPDVSEMTMSYIDDQIKRYEDGIKVIDASISFSKKEREANPDLKPDPYMDKYLSQKAEFQKQLEHWQQLKAEKEAAAVQ